MCECQGPLTAVSCQVGTVLLMALTCETKEQRFLLVLHNVEVGDLSCNTPHSHQHRITNATQLRKETALRWGYFNLVHLSIWYKIKASNLIEPVKVFLKFPQWIYYVVNKKSIDGLDDSYILKPWLVQNLVAKGCQASKEDIRYGPAYLTTYIAKHIASLSRNNFYCDRFLLICHSAILYISFHAMNDWRFYSICIS